MHHQGQTAVGGLRIQRGGQGKAAAAATRVRNDRANQRQASTCVTGTWIDSEWWQEPEEASFTSKTWQSAAQPSATCRPTWRPRPGQY
jgi:hypothetical protein